MRIRTFTLAAAAASLLLGVAHSAGADSRMRARCEAGNPNPSMHWDAVFDHTTSITQAQLVRRRLKFFGFTGVILEKDYCDDVEIAVPGLDTPGQRADFAKEAMVSHHQVSFEPPDILKQSQPGVVKAVFGYRPTVARAASLQQRIAFVGFREGSDVERLGLHNWRVVILNIPASSQDDFATEARRVGYTVTFLPQ
jgi:hypothetical protein